MFVMQNVVLIAYLGPTAPVTNSRIILYSKTKMNIALHKTDYFIICPTVCKKIVTFLYFKRERHCSEIRTGCNISRCFPWLSQAGVFARGLSPWP